MDDRVREGYRHYTPAFLKIYDLLVLVIYGPFVWRCPTSRLIQHYSRHMGRRHLDAGPGTGYFLARARPSADPHAMVLLVDPNPHVLAHATQRLRALSPSVLQADVLQPLPVTVGRFDSVALNYVLHCLPGPMPKKAPAIRNLAAVLEPEGVLFGATVLGTAALHTWWSRLALGENNRRGFFDNLFDSEDELRRLLGEVFEVSEIEIVGSVAVFSASRPRAALRS